MFCYCNLYLPTCLITRLKLYMLCLIFNSGTRNPRSEEGCDAMCEGCNSSSETNDCNGTWRFFPFVSWDVQYNKITCIHICNWWYKYYIRWQSIKIHWTIILYFSFVRLVIMLLEVVWKINNWIVSLRLCSYPFLLIFSISLDVFQETQLEQKRADRHSLLKSCKVNLSMIN